MATTLLRVYPDGPLDPKSLFAYIKGTGIMTIGPATALQGISINNNSGDPGTLTISNVIAGTANICAEGSGTVNLNAANTWSGGSLLGFSGAAFFGVWQFDRSSSFGTGGIYFSNCTGGAFVAEGTSPITIPNGVTNVSLAGGTASLNIVGMPAGVTFSGPWTLSGGKEPALNSGGTPASYSAVSIGSGGAANNLVTISGVISGTNTLTKFGVGILALSANNTFSGVVGVNNGTLQLTGTGSLNNCSTIFIETNGAGVAGTFDVSAYPNYTFGSSTKLQANGLGATVPATINGASGGSITLNSQPVYLNLTGNNGGDTGDYPLTVNQGTLVFNNNQIIVSNATATPLGPGNYTLIYANNGYSGTPNPNAGAVLGAGLATDCTATIVIGNLGDPNQLNLVVTASAATTPTTTTITPPAAVAAGTAPVITAQISPDPSASGNSVQFYVNGLVVVAATVASGGIATVPTASLATLAPGTYSISALIAEARTVFTSQVPHST